MGIIAMMWTLPPNEKRIKFIAQDPFALGTSRRSCFEWCANLVELINVRTALQPETIRHCDSLKRRRPIQPEGSKMACSKDRYAATYVVAPQLGPADCQVADFTDVQAAIAALPPAGGKIFVKAGTYPIKKTIRIATSNVQIQAKAWESRMSSRTRRL